MCSRDFGPASDPSLVMWPMRNEGTWFLLAKRKIRLATSRTWLIVPGLEDPSFEEKIVWTESTTRTRGLSFSAWARIRSRLVSARRIELPVPDAEPVAAELDLLEGLLAGDVEDGLVLQGDVARDLEEQGGLADAGLAADEDEGAQDDAAAEDLVELLDPDPEAGRSELLDVLVEDGLGRREGRPPSGRASASSISSTSVFHSPHWAQRPIHFGNRAPQLWQMKTVLSFIGAPRPTRRRPPAPRRG